MNSLLYIIRTYILNSSTLRQIGVHGLRENHFGRRVIALDTNYFILSRRYICHGCQHKAQLQRQLVENAATEAGLRVVPVHDTVVAHTFMGWDPKSVERLPHGHGEVFPAFLTWRGAVDKRVIDLMRPLFAAGLRPEVTVLVCGILVFFLTLQSILTSTEVHKPLCADIRVHDLGITCENVYKLLFTT